MNHFKTMFLLTSLTLVMVAVGAALGGPSGMAIALVLSLGMNFFSYWFSSKIVLRMYGAREVTAEEGPELHLTVLRLAEKAGLPTPKVYIIDEPQPNAFATGRNPKNGVVAVTTGLLNTLSERELEGVLAHELAHIQNRDILIGTVAAAIAGGISFIAQMAQWSMLFGGGDEEEEAGSPLAAIVMMIVGPIAALVIQMAISRSREYQADKRGAEISDPSFLAGALRKLHLASERLPMKASPATSHMFIVNPLAGGALLKLFSTHPPMEQRIARLEALSGFDFPVV